jgi:hypothetical protein
MSSDWPVWPLFILQGITFLLFFFPRNSRFLKIRFQTWVAIFLIIIAILIVISLSHDASSVLHLHF